MERELKKQYSHKKLFMSFIVLAAIPLGMQTAHASQLSVFDSTWTQIANDDGVASNGYVNPGWGGQSFDAEYLFFKQNGKTLSIGLQSGFDLTTGKVVSFGKNYWAGDLALSFNGATIGNAATYEYAVDFGLKTKDYQQDLVGPNGLHTAGLYSVTNWNTDVLFPVSNPFAMASGNKISGSDFLNSSGKGMAGGQTSYYRIVSFSLADIAGYNGEGLTLDAHWTMSCGNDAVDGSTRVAPVPEPATMLLFGTGLAGLAGAARKRKK